MYSLLELELAHQMNCDRLAFAEARRSLAMARAERRARRTTKPARPANKVVPVRVATAGPIGCTV